MCEYYVDYEVYEETKYSAFCILETEEYKKLCEYLDKFHKAQFMFINQCEYHQFKSSEKHYKEAVDLYKKISHIFLTDEVKEDYEIVEICRDNIDFKDGNQRRVKDDDDGYDWAEIEVEHNIRVLEEECGIKRDASKKKKNKKRENGRKEKKGKKYQEVPDIDIWDMFH